MTEIGEFAFEHCARLTQINIPDSVTEIGEGAFYESSSLTQITIPERVYKIGDMAFKGCTSLTQINIPTGLTEISNPAFQNCNQLRYIVVDSDSEIDRVKGLLPQDLRAIVTSFYCQHVANIKAIRRAQLYFLSSKMSLFNGCINDSVSTVFIAYKVYQFLSINELQLLGKTHKSLRPIRSLYDAIYEVKFRGDIPTTLNENTVTAQFLNEPSHTQDTLAKTITGYKERLKIFKKNIQKQVELKLLSSQQSQMRSSLEPPLKKLRHR